MRRHLVTGAGQRKNGVLAILSGLLILSAVLRLGGGTGAAIAEAVATDTPTADSTGPTSAVCPQADQVEAILDALKVRDSVISAREMQIADRQQALAVAESEIAERLEELGRAEESLRSTLSIAESAAETDLGNLTSVYENMKPRDAAALFAEMTPEFAAGFLGRMRPDAAAAIMTGLEPNVAYAVSVALAGRNARVPTE